MDDEKHVINDWSRKGIHVKSKESNLDKLVFDAIYNLRRILINQKIDSLKTPDFDTEEEREQNLESVVNYTKLKIQLAERLKRVI